MDKLLEDYKAYYSTRAKRYANNPNLKRSAEAEKNLSDAMQGCSVLEEFKERLGNKNELCATALTLDQAEYRLRVYTELKETVKAKGQADLLRICEPIQNVTELIQKSVDTMLESSKEISKDQGTVSFFKGVLTQLERVEIYENAEVTGGYDAKMKQWARDERQAIKESLASSMEEYRKYHPDFIFEWDGLWEERHRRLIPIPDAILTKRINQLKEILK